MGVELAFLPIAIIYAFSLLVSFRVSFRMAKSGRKTALFASLLVFLFYCVLPGLFVKYGLDFTTICGLVAFFTVIGSVSLLVSQRWALFKAYAGFGIMPLCVCLLILADIQPSSNSFFLVFIGIPASLAVAFYFPFIPAVSSVASVFFVRAIYEENRLGVFPR